MPHQNNPTRKKDEEIKIKFWPFCLFENIFKQRKIEKFHNGRNAITFHLI